MSQDSRKFSDTAIEQLLNYVIENNHEAIKRWVENKGVGILHADHEDFNKPILHIALDDKSNEVEAATVHCLIELRADIYKQITDQKEAIHSAVNGQNPKLLRVIIESIQNRDRLNAREALGNTALNLLIKEGNGESSSFMECVHILLKAGINVNIADNKAISPILWACVRRCKRVIEAIMECGEKVDIDTHKYGAKMKTARDYMIQNRLYDLPASRSLDSNENNITSPFWYIESNDQEGFLKLREINVDEIIKGSTLLQHACDRDQAKIVRHLVENNVDVRKTTSENQTLPLETAAYHGRDEIFEILLPKYEIIPERILTTLLINVPLYEGIHSGKRKCLDALLNSEQSIPVNERAGSQNTPLHYASVISDSSISLKLLKKGASLANRNDFDSIPIEDLDATILEQHFDNCITPKESGQGINFDHASILPTIDNKRVNTSIKATKFSNETDVIRVLSKTAELRHLLIHPLIARFIRIKWYKMRWFFWINLSLFVLFAVFFLIYVFVPTKKYCILWWFLMLTYVMLVLRELSQFILSRRTYCYSLSSILKVCILVACFYPICSKSMDMVYKQFCSVAIILIALKLVAFGAQHPLLSTYMVMLRIVAKNFFFFLLWYAVLILTFALDFYVLFRENGDAQNSNSSTAIEHHNNDAAVENKKCKDGKDNKDAFFNGLGLTIVKTIVMFTGELDASSIDFNGFWSHIIFILFVFMVSIILFNLLNGLAVSDINDIQSEAEVESYADSVSYIVYLENIIRGKPEDCLLRGCFRDWLLKLVGFWVKQISLVPDYPSNNKADINHDDFRYVYIDQQTVKRAEQILYKQNPANISNKRRYRAINMSDEEEVLPQHQHLLGCEDSRSIIGDLKTRSNLADKNVLNKLGMIDPESLKFHLDSCISAEVRGNGEIKVALDYNTILPNSSNTSGIKTVHAIAQIPRLQHLLIHPLISSFVYIKWRKMRWFFYGNVALIVMFWIFLSVYVTLLDRKGALFYSFFAILVILYFLLIARECLQLIALKQKYFCKLSNWFEMLMLFLCGFTFLHSSQIHKQFCALSLLAVVLELTTIAKAHPTCSQQIIMLRTVTLTFFRFLFSYSLLLIAFGLSFYKLFYEKDNETEGIINGISLSFFKIVIMLTGELNATSFKFETWVHGMLFITFVLVVPVMLLNLLCGLAVFDVDQIRNQAEIIGSQEVVKFIVFTEKYIRKITQLRLCFSFLRRKILLQLKDLENRKYVVYPHRRHQTAMLIGEITIRRIATTILLHNDNRDIIKGLGTLAK